MMGKADNNKGNGGLKAGRVVVNLTREDLEFIDNIGRDALFTTGKRLTNNKIICAFVSVMKEIKIKGDSLYNTEELKNRILVKLRIKKELRTYPRFKKEVTLSWRKASSGERHKEGLASDICEGGFRIELREDRKVGDILEFAINDPDEPYNPIMVFGRISWIKKRDEDSGLEAGVKITELSEKDRPRFSRLLYKEFYPGFYATERKDSSKQ